MTKEKIKDQPKGCVFNTVLVIGIVLILIAVGCSYVNKKFGWVDDHPAEEILESVIQSQTGVEIDLTPGSPEK